MRPGVCTFPSTPWLLTFPFKYPVHGMMTYSNLCARHHWGRGPILWGTSPVNPLSQVDACRPCQDLGGDLQRKVSRCQTGLTSATSRRLSAIMDVRAGRADCTSPWSWRAIGSAAMSSALADMTAARKGCLSWKTPGSPCLQKVGSQTQEMGCKNACRGPGCMRTPRQLCVFLWRNMAGARTPTPACMYWLLPGTYSGTSSRPLQLCSFLRCCSFYERLLEGCHDGPL